MQSLTRAGGHMRSLRQSTGRCSSHLFAARRHGRQPWPSREEFEEYRPSDEEFEEEKGQFREYQGRQARRGPHRGPRRGHSPAEVPAPQLRYLFKVPKYVPMEGKYSVLKVAGDLPELGSWDPDDAPAMRVCEDFSWELDIWLPVRSFYFKVVALPDSSNSSDSERWEAEGKDTNRHVEVVAGSTSQLLNPFAADPDPVELTVEVNCTWGDASRTALALVMDTFSLKGAVALLKVSATEGTDGLEQYLQELLDKGLDTKRAWRGRVLALAEAVDTSADSEALACMSEQLKKVSSPPQPFVSMPIKRVHVPADTSIAALGRLAHASYLPIEEAHAQLAPPQSLRERLEERQRERLEESGSRA